MTAPGISALWRIWTCYLLGVLAAVLAFGASGGGEGYHPWWFVAIHAALLAGALALRRLGPARSRICVALFCLGGLPVVFSSIGLVLPGIHPEAYEWRWLAFDRALLGVDPTVALQACLTPWLTEVLQWCYAGFYLIPICAIAGSGLASGEQAFDRSLGVVTLGFLSSYLGYFLWPTLPPYLFLHHADPLRGVWLAESLHRLIDRAELNRWDCFPSGHTMLSVVSLGLSWRHARRLFWVLLPVVAALVFSTVALRYHFVADVLAGLCGVPLVFGAWRLIEGRERTG